MSKILSLCSLLFSVSCLAQLPESEVWLFKLEKDKQGTLLVKLVGNISARKGYDNQPRFSANGRILYYVSSNNTNTTDVLAFETGNKKTRPFVQTSNSEYSPLPVDTELACVVVESDSSQKIHFFDLEKGTFVRRLAFDSVGYHCFLNRDTLAYYKLGEPPTLRLHVQSTGEDRWMADRVTRSLFSPHRSQLVYGTSDNGIITVYLYDFLLRKGRKLAAYPFVSEDFFYDKRYGLLRPEDGRILQFDEKKNSWSLWFDLSVFGVKSIGRIITSPDGKFLAIVSKD